MKLNLISRIHYWLKYKLPWVIKRRSDYLKEIRIAREQASHEAWLSVREREKMLDDLLPKLFRVYATRQEYGVYKCAVQFSTGLVEAALVHGNSQEEIYFIARRLSAMIERELHTINFARIPRIPQ